MGLFDAFRKKNKDSQGPDVTKGLTLANMQPGWMVDHDLDTWEVKAHNIYDWSEGDLTHEWQLASADSVVYLELESDDLDDWSLNRPIEFSSLGPEVRRAILENGDPPDQVTYEGVAYYLEEMAGGAFLKNGQGPGRNLLRWDYEDEEGENYLTIEQWGEDDFLAYAGRPVQEYQFTNILPPA